jgi:imidazolonepropionase
MRKVTLIRGARQLLTLRGPSGPRRGADLRNLGIIQDGAVLIADGLIREVGPSRRLENLALARGAEEIDASGRVVMPGFVDVHLHLAGGDPELSPRTIETLALRVLEQAVRHGTTALEAKSGLGISGAGELKILRAYAALRELPITSAPTFVAATAGQDFERLLPALRRRKLAEFAEIRCEENTFDPAQACRFLSTACQLGLGLKLSAGSSAAPGAIAMAVEMGVTAVDDVVDVAEHDAMLLGRSQAIATLSPGPIFLSGNGCAPPRRLIESGAAIALASGWHPEDAPWSNMQMTIAVACRTMHMTAAEAISAATINGAHAMQRAGGIGSIESGKSADLLMLSVPDYRELPNHFGVNLVDLVMCRGAVLVERSEVRWPVR